MGKEGAIHPPFCMIKGELMGKTMEQYIAEISKVLKQNIANREKIVEPVCNVLYEDKPDRLVIIASGSSYNAAVCAEAFMKHYLGERVKIQTPFCLFRRAAAVPI